MCSRWCPQGPPFRRSGGHRRIGKKVIYVIDMEQEYIITIFSENSKGLLNQVTTVFIYRDINIESITASESSVGGIHQYTIVVRSEREKVEKAARQIEKKIDVLKVYVFTPEEVVQQEIALYKVAHNKDVEKLVREQHVRILEVEDDCIVLEKTGYTNETQALFELLKPYGVFQFVRSGTVAVSRYNKELLEEYI